MTKKVKLKPTQRGFQNGEFTDANGEKCSIQESSAMRDKGDALLWLGTDDPWPKVFYPHGRGSPTGESWADMSRELPPGADNILCCGRMHLSQKQIKRLLPLLKYFAKYGRLPA